MDIVTLDKLKIGEVGEVISIKIEDTLYQRLLDIGLIPGSKLKCILRSPLKDPIAYLINGAIIAIRKKDTEKILVLLKEEDSNEY